MGSRILVKIGSIIGVIGSILAWRYIFPDRLFPAILIAIFLMIFFSSKKKRQNPDSKDPGLFVRPGR